jgi:hypothetical protein
MFLGLPDPDLLARGMDPDPNPALDPDPYPVLDPDPDPSIIMQKKLDSYYFVTVFDIISLKNDVNVASKSNKQKKLF